VRVTREPETPVDIEEPERETPRPPRRPLNTVGDLLDDVTYPVRRRFRRLGEGIAEYWFSRSIDFRRRAAGIAGVVGVYVVLKALILPALPCQVPGGDTCPATDDAAKLVPGDALLYVHLDLDGGSDQYKQAKALADELPHSQGLLQAAIASLSPPSGGQVDVEGQIQPWLGDEAALSRLPGPGAGDEALLLASGDDAKAVAFADRIAPSKATLGHHGGVVVRNYAKGFGAAVTGGFLVLGKQRAVLRVIDTQRLPATALAAAAGPKAIRDQLPGERFADLYLSKLGVRTLLAGRGGLASQLDTFADYPASRGLAASAQAHSDGIEFQLESNLDPNLERRHPPFFRAFETFNPSLAKEVSSEALVYLGVGNLAGSVRALLDQAAKTAPELAKGFNAFRSGLSARSKVDITKEVLPSLAGQAALVVEPTAQIPYVALIVDGIDEQAAGTAVAKLAAPIARAGGRRSDVASALSETEIEGVRTTTIRLSPSVNLAFAVFDGKLVIGTDPAAIREVKSGKHSLSGTDAYEQATSHVGGDVSSLVFLNLQELFGLAERAGLAENPAYATFSEDIGKLKALAVGVSNQRDRLSTKFFLTIE
jgi:hypothetical protein